MSVYRVTDVIGTSAESWEDAAAVAIGTAAGTLRDLRVAEVVAQDIAVGGTGASPIEPSCASRSGTRLSSSSIQHRADAVVCIPTLVAWRAHTSSDFQ
jgi:flavin-binding protein dodecin